jgi:hypothetical protein
MGEEMSSTAMITSRQLNEVKAHMIDQHYWSDTDVPGRITPLWAKSHRDEHACASADQWTHTHGAEFDEVYREFDALRRQSGKATTKRVCQGRHCVKDISHRPGKTRFCGRTCQQRMARR